MTDAAPKLKALDPITFAIKETISQIALNNSDISARITDAFEHFATKRAEVSAASRRAQDAEEANMDILVSLEEDIAPMRRRMRIKNTTINQINTCIYVLGVHLCNSRWIRRLWLSRYNFSSAALFRELEHRLIVLNYAFSYNNSPMKLKLSQT